MKNNAHATKMWAHLAHTASKTKVTQLDSCSIQQHVFRLDVAVHNALVFKIFERVCNLLNESAQDVESVPQCVLVNVSTLLCA